MKLINNRPVFIYDLETFPNIFTFDIKPVGEAHTTYEISDRRNDIREILECMKWLKSIKAYLVGFNNLGFDYPIIHSLIGGAFRYSELYDKCQAIIGSIDGWGHTVWENKHYVEQIDLYKIHHFDNKSKSTSLKILEFNMRLPKIQDLPYKPGTMLNHAQKDHLIPYNRHDVDCTEAFYLETVEAIQERVGLSKKYNKNVMNFNDGKIGKDYLISQIGDHLCYKKIGKRRVPIQTKRPTIAFNDIIMDVIAFERPEFQEALEKMRAIVIPGNKLKGSVKFSAVLDGFSFDFGSGGLHGSVDRQIFHTGNGYTVIDIDVEGYYPSLGIAQGFFPAHLGEAFVKAWADIKTERATHDKGTTGNKMMKLAGNSAYGDSNNEYSPLLDPQFTCSITINGQLLLCMLAEQMMKVPGLHMIQANTDGLTFYCPNEYIDHTREVCKWWEGLTGLVLEEAIYKSMYIRDVNNYLAITTDGKYKRKNCYNYKLEWHQDHSALVIPKIAEKVLVEGADPEKLIREWDDPYDFYYRAKVTGKSRLVIESGYGDIEQQKVTRYYVAEEGYPLVKIMKPLAKSVDGKDRRFAIQAKKLVIIQNNVTEPPRPNYSHYLEQIRKITEPLKVFDPYYVAPVEQAVEGFMPRSEHERAFAVAWAVQAHACIVDETGGKEYQRAYSDWCLSELTNPSPSDFIADHVMPF